MVDPSGFGAVLGGAGSRETRLYKCLRCGTENEVALLASEWRLIDRRILAALDPASLRGRAREDDGDRRTRLESDLSTVRGWSLSICAAALTLTGLSLVIEPDRRTSPVGLVIGAAVALLSLANSLPLRQSPHPPQKVPQLHGRLTWRHRLLVLSALGFGAEIIATLVIRLR
ncbi:hypothetical protein [Streptomyces canus]|uniref:hypothetical protein n=1 Tax=Streptomyces canus TaxID=58343 RepID=UPI0036EFBB76